eukprot:gene452-2440_t
MSTWEEAVKIALGPAPDPRKEQAEADLCQFQRTDDAWRECFGVLQRCSPPRTLHTRATRRGPTNYDHNVTFWSCQTLLLQLGKRFAAASQADKDVFEAALMYWIKYAAVHLSLRLSLLANPVSLLMEFSSLRFASACLNVSDCSQLMYLYIAECLLAGCARWPWSHLQLAVSEACLVSALSCIPLPALVPGIPLSGVMYWDPMYCVVTAFMTLPVASVWPDFWPKLLGTLSSDLTIDLYLRILETIDERAVSRESGNSRATKIKDAMRQGCVADLVAVWGQILQQYGQSDPELAIRLLPELSGLDVLPISPEWIDVYLIVQPDGQGMALLLSLLSQSNLRVDVLELLLQIVGKKMERGVGDKLAMLERARLHESIPMIVDNALSEVTSWGTTFGVLEDEEYPIKAASLVTAYARDLLQLICDDAAPGPRAHQLLSLVAPSVLKMFDCPYILVSTATLDFVKIWIKRPDGKVDPTVADQLDKHMFEIIYSRIRFTNEYNACQPDAYEAAVDEQRK